MNKAVIESYARNLLGQLIGAAVVVQAATGVAVTDFQTHEILLVANALWASLVPVALRWVNKNDPAFGRIAEAVAVEATKKVAKATQAK